MTINQDDLQKRILEAESTLKDTDERVKIAEKVAFLTSENTRLKDEHRRMLTFGGRFRNFIEQVTSSVASSEPYPFVAYERHASVTSLPVVAMAGDWQTGEVIRPQETEGFGEFNWEIEQDFVLNQYVPKLTDWITLHRRAYKIDKLHIFGLNDWVSGDIHDELRITNEFPLPVQTANAGILLGEMIRRLAPQFAEVHVWEMGGDNHGRLQKKPQAKQKTANNMSYLVYAIANAYLREHKNVVVHSTEAMTMLAEVEQQRFLLQHGDTIKGWMGIPHYGIERSKAREAMRRMGKAELEFHYMALGHFHTPSFWQNVLVNGALTGTTEFDHSMGRFGVPSQTSFLVHPKHGIFDYTPWKFYVAK